MFNLWLLYISGTLLIFILVVPDIDKDYSPYLRYSRLTLFHRIFTFRNEYFPFLIPRPDGMDSDGKALEELFELYYPKLNLSENVTSNEIKLLRYHSKRLLTALHPIRTSSCLIQHQIFEYYNKKAISVYAIQHDQIHDWRTSSQPLIVYFHGGGFVFGDIHTYSGFECHLSKQLNMLVLHVSYRLIPEYSFVDIIEDIINVYQVLLDGDPNINQRLIGMGDSSGGLLWIHLLQWIQLNDKPQPKAVVLHSPWPNFDFLEINNHVNIDAYLSFSFLLNLRKFIIGNDRYWFQLSQEERNQFNPIENYFHGFPPLYITVGAYELFTDEIRILTEKIIRAGGQVLLDEGEGLMHSYALFHLWSSKAQNVQNKIRSWIYQQLSMNNQSI